MNTKSLDEVFCELKEEVESNKVLPEDISKFMAKVAVDVYRVQKILNDYNYMDSEDFYRNVRWGEYNLHNFEKQRLIDLEEE